MKMTRLRAGASLAALVLASIWAPAALAAGSAADSNANVLRSTTVSSLLELDFGTIASNNLGGVVSLNVTSGQRDCAIGMACSNAFAFATLQVTGDATNVQVTYDPIVQLSGPGTPMDAVIQFPGGQGTSIALVNGAATVYFGADLTVNTNQTPGSYAGTFNVSVNYQ